MEEWWLGFPFAVVLSLVLVAIGYFFIRHSKYFK